LATERIAHQVHQLHDKVTDATRVADETRELRRLVERADATTQDFKFQLEAEAAHQHNIVEVERELRGKEFAETHAALAVTRGRLSILEGTVGVHTSQLKELGNVEDRVLAQHHRVEALERALASAEADRKSAFELLESRVKDEHSIMGTALEVKSQEILRTMMLGLEQMEIKFRDEMNETVGRVDSVCQELSRTLDDKDFALRSTVQSLSDNHTALEDRFRSEKADNHAKHMEAQSALDSALLPLRSQLNDLSRELVAKHRDHENRFATMAGVFEGKLCDEIGRSCREGDAKLQETTRALDTRFSELLDRLARDNAAEHQQHPVRLNSAIETLERRISEDLSQLTKENEVLDKKHRDEVQQLEQDISAKCDRIQRDLTSGLNDKEKDLRAAIRAVSDASNSESRALKLQHAVLSSSVDALDQRARDAQVENHAKHLETRDNHQRSLESAVAPLQQQIGEHAAKHGEHDDILKALDTKLLDEVNRLSKEGDAKLQSTTAALDSKFSDELACATRRSDEEHQKHPAQLSNAIDSLELKLRHELRNSNADQQLKLETVRRELALSADEKEKVLRSIIQGLSDVHAASSADTQNAHAMLRSSHDLLDQRVRQDKVENHAKHMESREANNNAVQDAVASLKSQIQDLSKDVGCKHQDHADRLEALHAVFGSRLVDEINRMSSEVDLKMNNLVSDFNGKIREGADSDAKIAADVSRLERELESHDAQHGARLASTAQSLESKFRQDLHEKSGILQDTFERRMRDDKLDNHTKHEETRALGKSSVDGAVELLRSQLNDISRDVDTKHRECVNRLETFPVHFDAKISDEILRVSREGDMKFEKLNANLLSHAADVDSKIKAAQAAGDAKLSAEVARVTSENDAQHQSHPVRLAAAIDSLGGKVDRDLENLAKEHMAKHSEVQSSLSTAHWNAQKFKDDIARHVGDIQATNNKVSSIASRIAVLEEKHLVCDDFNKARSVLESLALKVEAFPVDLHRETIRLSDSAEKKHGELRDAQRADMVRLREEIARLVLEMNGQNDVALQHMTASVEALDRKIAAEIGNRVEDVKSEREDRSREVADLATAVHSLETHLSSTPVHTPIISVRRPYALSTVTTTSLRP
jgi:hypothetical protein